MSTYIMEHLIDGNLNKVKKIIMYGNIDIHANNEQIFRWSCRSKNMEVPKWLLQYSIDIKSPIDIYAIYRNNNAFNLACCFGNLETVKWLWDLSCKNNNPYNLQIGNYCGFRLCCLYGNLETLKWIYELSIKVNNPIDIRMENDYAFKKSCVVQKNDIAEWLCSICPEYSIIYDVDKNKIEYKIKSIIDRIKENKNNKNKLKLLTQNFAQIEENNDFSCLVCCRNKNYILNLKCNNKFDHCFCVDCFYQWYSKNTHICAYCKTHFTISENKNTRIPVRRNREE